MSTAAFDASVDVYDALIDWPKRLANEEPFYHALFERVGVKRVLDVACGTGRHAAMFHSWGLEVEGADVSPAMIERCRSQFGETESLHWAIRAFDQAYPSAAGRRCHNSSSEGGFDAVVCVGNSLALASDRETALRAVGGMIDALRPGGVCIVQVLNLWHLPEGPCVWQKCKRATIAGGEHLIVKGVHRAGERGFVDLIDVTIAGEQAVPRYESAAFWGLEDAALGDAARRAGASDVRIFGGFHSEAYARERSSDLVLVATKK